MVDEALPISILSLPDVNVFDLLKEFDLITSSHKSELTKENMRLLMTHSVQYSGYPSGGRDLAYFHSLST
mgnify:CR=1 FL=1